jgi:AraC family transcriptional regulator
VPSEPLPESCAVAIVDWHCPGHDTARGDVELAPTHEVVVPRHGAYLRECRGELSWLDPGSVSFANPGDHYRVRHPAPGGDRCTLFALSGREARAILGPDARFPRLHGPLPGGAYLLHRLALGASRARRAHPAAGLASEEYAIAFLRAAVDPFAPRVPPVRRVSECVMAAREMIARRYREPLTLGDIATASGCSAFHLSRQFTRTFGVPIWRQVLRLRLRDALERMLETQERLSLIALAAGFGSQSHFGDAFRAEFGEAPGRVRRLARPALRELRGRARNR